MSPRGLWAPALKLAVWQLGFHHLGLMKPHMKMLALQKTRSVNISGSRVVCQSVYHLAVYLEVFICKDKNSRVS